MIQSIRVNEAQKMLADEAESQTCFGKRRPKCKNSIQTVLSDFVSSSVGFFFVGLGGHFEAKRVQSDEPGGVFLAIGFGGILFHRGDFRAV